MSVSWREPIGIGSWSLYAWYCPPPECTASNSDADSDVGPHGSVKKDGVIPQTSGGDFQRWNRRGSKLN